MNNDFENVVLASWDPLEHASDDPGIYEASQKREICNILKSYTGSYDLFSEMLQNSLDAVERRLENEDDCFSAKIWLDIDIDESSVTIVDNGCGMSEEQFRQFLIPNFSFKESNKSRGVKGVGATYLAYGYNYLEISTKRDGKSYSGVLKDGRRWVEDNSGTVSRVC